MENASQVRRVKAGQERAVQVRRVKAGQERAVQVWSGQGRSG